MKMFTYVSILFCLLLLTIHSLKAQEYSTSVGARLGYPVSASLKHFLNDKGAVEVYAGTRGWASYRWYHVSGGYQFHKPIRSIDNLSYYFGGGASVFFWNYDFEFLLEDYSSTSIGAQGYLGLDYSFEDAPINLSLDWIPTIYFGSAFTTGFSGGFGSLSVRYILKR